MGHRRHEDVMRAYKELGMGSPEDFGWGSGGSYRRGGPDWDPQGFGGQYKSGLDKFGFSNILPEEHIAPEVQFMAEKKAAWRNDRLMAQSLKRGRGYFEAGQGALQQGLETMQAYRPGGAAAMTSPYYTGKASMYAQQADWDLRGSAARRQEAPNLMFRFDERYRKKAREDARRAGAVQIGGMLLGAAATIATGGAAAPLMIGAMGAAATQDSAGNTLDQQGNVVPGSRGGVGGDLTAGAGGGAGVLAPGAAPGGGGGVLPAGGGAQQQGPGGGAGGGGQFPAATGGGAGGGGGAPPAEGGGAPPGGGGGGAPSAPPMTGGFEAPSGASQAGPTAQALSQRTGIPQTTLDANLWALDNPEGQQTFVEYMTDRLRAMAGYEDEEAA